MHTTNPVSVHRRRTRLVGVAGMSLFALAACGTSGGGYDYAAAIDWAASLENTSVVYDVAVTGAVDPVSARFACDLFAGVGTDCTLDWQSTAPDGSPIEGGDSGTMQIRYETGADVAYLTEPSFEQGFVAAGLDPKPWISAPADDDLADTIGLDPATVDLEFASALADATPTDNGTVDRAGERLRRYTVTLDAETARRTFANQIELFELPDPTATPEAAPIDIDVFVTEGGQLRIVEFTLDMERFSGETADVTVTIEELPADAAFTLPDPAEVHTFASGYEFYEFAVDVDTTDLVAERNACAAGNMGACDTLYLESPSGSDDEAFGGSCGGTTDGSTPGQCGATVGAITMDPAEVVEQTARALARDADATAVFNSGDDLGVTTAANIEMAFADAAAAGVFDDGMSWLGDIDVTVDDPDQPCYEIGLGLGADVVVFSVSVAAAGDPVGAVVRPGYCS